MTTANILRGEVDLVLDGTSFVLRPAHEAQLEVEKLTGKSILKLATTAADGELSLGDATIITTEFIRAWGRQTENSVAMHVDGERIGQLISEYGLMKVILRLALVLKNAVMGGCKADGTPKQGEAMPATGTESPPAAGSPGSRAQRSGGARTNTGRRPRTSSGPRTKSGAK